MMISRQADAPWRRRVVVAALMMSAFTFNTAENLPIGLLRLIATGLDTPVPAIGYLVTGYGLTVAVVSLPLTHLTRGVPRRYLLGGVLSVLVVASAVTALAPSYGILLVARIATAAAQALFWAVMGPVAVGLFPAEMRGRVIGLLSLGGSLATVVGVPAGTWLGQHSSWMSPFLAMSGLGGCALSLLMFALPTSRPEEGHAAYGSAPSVRRFLAVLAVTALSVTGAFAGFTYVVELLGASAGFSGDSVSALLLLFGATGFLGVAVTARLLDGYPQATLSVPLVLQTLALLILGWGGTSQSFAVLGLTLLGVSVGPIFVATQSRALYLAPGRTELALAGNSAVFNVGVAAGALAGGVVLPWGGVRGAFLMGGLLSLGALAVQLRNQLRHRIGSTLARTRDGIADLSAN